MTVSDLDRVHHCATIDGDSIRVGALAFDSVEFVLSGLVLVDYSEAEEAELLRLEILSPRLRGSGPKSE